MSLARAEGAVPGRGQGDRRWRFGAGDCGRTRTPRNAFDSRNWWGITRRCVLVGTRAEAIAVLLGGRRPPGPTSSMFGTPAPVPRARQRPALTIDSDLRAAAWNGRSVPLSPLEHDLLRCLLAERRPHLRVRGPAPPASGGTRTSATAPTSSRWSSGCAASSAISAARSRSCRARGRAAAGRSARLARRAPPEIPRLDTWTSTPRTTTGSPGSPRARCRSRSPTRRPTRGSCSSRPAPATTTASRWRSSPSCRCAATPSTTCSSRTPCSRRSRRRSPSVVAGSADLLPVLVVGAPLVHGTRVLNCAVVIHRGRGARRRPEVLPADLPRVLRAPLVRPRRRPAGRARSGRRRSEVPFGPDLVFEATDVPGLELHVEICEDMWVPVPPSAEAALAGATVLANLSGSPITVARAEDRRLLVRWASARCSAAYVFAAAGQGESTTDLCWDGQTMVYECGDLLGESERFPDGRAAHRRRRRPRPDPAGADPAGDVRRQPPHPRRAGSTTSAPSRSSCSRPTGDIGLRRKVDRFPFVPDDVERLALDCYEAYNIQVSGLEQRLHAIGQPKVVIGVSGGLDSTHALIVAAKAMDRLGRPRSDIHAFTMPGFATGDTTKSYATRLSKSLGVTFEEIDITAAANQMLADLDHPYADGEEVYDVTFENVQAGPAHRLPLPARQPPRRHRARHRRPVRARARLVHVRRRRPDVALQRQRRRPEDADPAPDPLGERQRRVRGRDQRAAPRDRRAGDHPRADPDPRGRTCRSRPRQSVGPYSLQDFTLFHVLRRGYRPSKIAFLAWHAWRDADRGGVAARASREERRTAYDLPTIRRWLEVFVQAVLRQPVQAVRAAQRAQGQRRRHHVAARRLADAVRRRAPPPGWPRSRPTSRES